MKKKQQLALIGAAILALFLFRKGGSIPPPPPQCPVGYTSDGSKCVPDTPPPISNGFRLSLNPSDVTTVDFELRFRIYVPQGFSGCFKLNVKMTANNQEVGSETWSRDLTNFGGGYLDNRLRILLPAPNTLYSVFGYITDCAMTQRYTPIALTQVRSG